jgi:hypothetical protein
MDCNKSVEAPGSVHNRVSGLTCGAAEKLLSMRVLKLIGAAGLLKSELLGVVCLRVAVMR